MPEPPGEEAIAAEILRQVAQCGAAKSVSPGDVARALAGNGDEERPWRPLLGRVRQVALRLAREGRIEILRKGRPVPPEAARGVIRLRLAGG